MQMQSYQTLLETSRRINWRVDDLIGGDRRLDFSRPFLPETFARTAPLTFLSADEKLTLNHIRAHGYLAMFELVETFILPFVVEQSDAEADDADPFREAALKNFAEEEAKHIELFRRFKTEFAAGFGQDCGFIGPADAIAAEILRHGPLGVAILVLGIEWMSQGHYVESVKDDADLDPQFKSLLRHHWMEEAQHAKLDTLMVEALAESRDEDGIRRAIDGLLDLCAFLDEGLAQQAIYNLDAFEIASGRTLSEREREALAGQQHQALRWTYIGSALTHPKFLATVESLSPTARDRIARLAPTFA